MTASDLLDLVSIKAERRSLEFKHPRSRKDKGHLAEVAKACLGLANTRDGGRVVIGIDRTGEIIGLDTDQAASWREFDAVLESIAAYADPWVGLSSQVLELDVPGVGKKVLAVIEVQEFDAVPVFCRKDGRDARSDQILRKGALYVRALEKIATVEVQTPEQMRELFDLGVEKRLAAIERTVQRAGKVIAPREMTASDESSYQHELEAFRRGA